MELEPLRAGGAGVEEQRAAEPFNLGLVRVAEDADIGLLPIQKHPPFLGQLPALVEDVPDGNPFAGKLDELLRLDPALPVPVHAGHGP